MHVLCVRESVWRRGSWCVCVCVCVALFCVPSLCKALCATCYLNEKCYINKVRLMWLPVSSGCRCPDMTQHWCILVFRVQILFMCVQFGVDLEVYVGVIRTSCFCGIALKSTAQPCPPGITEVKTCDNFSSSRSEDDTDWMWSLCC